MNERLVLERQRLAQAWHRYIESRSCDLVPDQVIASWQRSSQTVSPERVAAPLETDADARHAWDESRLEHASRPVLAELASLADEGDMVIALGDAHGQLLWTYGSARMQGLARSINFVPGGHWDESSVGTNALALALRHRRPLRVFAAEHYVQAVHDWVCYSSPIQHPRTGELLGVLDFSTTWQHSTPLGLAGARYYAQQIEQGLLTAPERPAETPGTLRLTLCGTPEARRGTERLHLTRRQFELLGVLALNPAGLSLDALHAHVYGDQMISLSTLKAEMSGLRVLLDGQIASRPYRLSMPVTFDVMQVEHALLGGDIRYHQIIAATVIGRLGLGIILPALNLATLRHLEPHQMGQASVVVSFARQLGGVLGVAIMAVFVEWREQSHGADAPGILIAYAESFMALAVVLGLASIAALLMKLESPPPVRHTSP